MFPLTLKWAMAKNMFSQKLNQAILDKNSRLCVGLDPRLNLIPSSIISKSIQQFGKTNQAAAIAILTFNKQVIDAVLPHAACVKLQSAFYEQFGSEGVRAFWDTAKYAETLNLPVIADIKRGDIDSTATAYAEAYLGSGDLFGEKQTTPIDSITINPFLGEDSLEPFVKIAHETNKGLFILVKTSNPGSKDLQDLEINGQTVSQRIATYLSKQNTKLDEFGYGLIGAVVGATYPEHAKQLRQQMPTSIFLVPGIGAQGGDPTLLKNFFDKNGLGAVVNSSRGLVFSFEENDKRYLKKITQAALDTKELINNNL